MAVEEEELLEVESAVEKPLAELVKASGVQLDSISGKKERINAPLFLIH